MNEPQHSRAPRCILGSGVNEAMNEATKASRTVSVVLPIEQRSWLVREAAERARRRTALGPACRSWSAPWWIGHSGRPTPHERSPVRRRSGGQGSREAPPTPGGPGCRPARWGRPPLPLDGRAASPAPPRAGDLAQRPEGDCPGGGSAPLSGSGMPPPNPFAPPAFTGSVPKCSCAHFVFSGNSASTVQTETTGCYPFGRRAVTGSLPPCARPRNGIPPGGLNADRRRHGRFGLSMTGGSASLPWTQPGGWRDRNIGPRQRRKEDGRWPTTRRSVDGPGPRRTFRREPICVRTAPCLGSRCRP